MDNYGRTRAVALQVIVRDIPRDFWTDFRNRARAVYPDIFHEVASDPNILPQQRIDKLLQDRHFRMEKLLVDLADQHGLAHSATRLVANNRCYAYVTGGDIGFTQSYVQTMGALPHAAKFRERLANEMGMPRLDLGDEPSEVLIGKQFYALIAHNPMGRRFRAEEQNLGSVQLCFPSHDFKAWALEFAFEEIIASYPAKESAPKPMRELAWREQARPAGANEGK